MMVMCQVVLLFSKGMRLACLRSFLIRMLWLGMRKEMTRRFQGNDYESVIYPFLTKYQG